MKPAAMKKGFRMAGMLAALAISTASHADKIYFVHNDHLGTPQVITDENKNVVWEVDRDPWGNITNVLVDDLPNNVSLPGQYYDEESGLHYNWNRYMDPTTGRYITSDPIGLRGGINSYIYAGGNPIVRFDFTGLIWVTTDIKYHHGNNTFLINAYPREQGEVLGSSPNSYAGTQRTVYQKWKDCKCENTGRNGETREVEQTFINGPDGFAVGGKAWYWSPVIELYPTCPEDEE